MKACTKTTLLCVSAMFLLAGCATWSTSSVNQNNTQKQAVSQKTNVENITVTEGDIKNRKYKSLGDITVTVNKTTAFNRTPTQDDVNIRLKEEAADLGADAVIFARYGQSGISLMSWGSLEGNGRAVKFEN